MYYFELKSLVYEKMGRDLGSLVLGFLKEDPVPWCWDVEPQISPWDPLVEVDCCSGIALSGVNNF